MSKRKADSIETVEDVEAADTAKAVQSVEDFVPHRARDAPEIWKVIPRFPKYEASSRGRVRNVKSRNHITIQNHPSGYNSAGLHTSDGKRTQVVVAQLVLSALVGTAKGDQTADHLNRDKKDDNLCNLRWASRVEQAMNRKIQEKRFTNSVQATSLDGTSVYLFKSMMDARSFVNVTGHSSLISAIKTGKPYKGFFWAHDETFKPNVDAEVRPIPGLTGYFASSDGLIQMKSGARWTKGYQVQSGYLYVNAGGTKSVHSLIALTFHGPRPSKFVIDHINGIKGDNSRENLEYVTSQENRIRGIQLNPSSYHPVNERAVIQSSMDGVYIKKHASVNGAQRESGVKATNISKCLKNKRTHAGNYRWAYATDK